MASKNIADITIPVDASENPAFLLTPELLAVLSIWKEEHERLILGITFDMEMPKRDLANVINLQGKLSIINEIIAINDRAERPSQSED